jgi:hypothetical protein
MMIRSLLLLILTLAAARSVHAQGTTRTDPPNSGGLRAAYDPRLLATTGARAPLGPAASVEAALTLPAPARGSYWKAGAIVGGVLGGVVGGAGGYALDNIERPSPRAGEFTFIGAAGGALAGALLGAGIGALIGK